MLSLILTASSLGFQSMICLVQLLFVTPATCLVLSMWLLLLWYHEILSASTGRRQVFQREPISVLIYVIIPYFITMSQPTQILTPRTRLVIIFVFAILFFILLFEANFYFSKIAAALSKFFFAEPYSLFVRMCNTCKNRSHWISKYD